MKVVAQSSCPCGSGRTFEQCCGRCLAGEPAPDAEALMRSRYTAYVLRDEAYLLATWHPETRPERLDLAAEAGPRWLGLTVKRHVVTAPDRAEVEFVARYRVDGRGHRMHESSHFVRDGGRWYYVNGDLTESV